MNKKIIHVISVILFLFSFQLSQAFIGSDIWQIGSYIEYEVNLSAIYNHDILPPDQFPNMYITGATLKIEYKVYSANWMIFEISTTDPTLSEFLNLNYDNQYQVDPETGLDINGDWSGCFYDTSDFEDGYVITDIVKELRYSDDYGDHVITKYYKVIGEPFDYTAVVENKEVSISCWRLEAEDIIASFSYEGLEFRITYDDSYFIISKDTGVMLEHSYRYQEGVILDGDYVYLDKITESIAVTITKDVLLENNNKTSFNTCYIVISIFVLGIYAYTLRIRRKINKPKAGVFIKV